MDALQEQVHHVVVLQFNSGDMEKSFLIVNEIGLLNIDTFCDEYQYAKKSDITLTYFFLDYIYSLYEDADLDKRP